MSRFTIFTFSAILMIAGLLGLFRSQSPTRSNLGPVAQWVPLQPEVPHPIASSLTAAEARRSEGRLEESWSRFEEALVSSRQHHSPIGQAWALNGQALVAKARGELYQALALYQQAHDLFQTHGDRRGEAVALHNMGSCFTAVGELGLARDRYGEALDAHPSDAGLATTLSHLATLEDLDGDSLLAYQRFREAVSLRRSNLAESPRDRTAGTAFILDRLGSAASSLEPAHCAFEPCPDVARRAFDSALGLLARLDRQRDLAITSGNLGLLEIGGCSTATHPCDPQAAILRFDRALASEALRARPGDQATLMFGKARALRHGGRLADAEATLLQALERVEELKDPALQPMLQATLLARYHRLHEELITLWIERDRQAPRAGYELRALNLADQARARDLQLRVLGPWKPGGPQGSLRRLNELEHERLERIDRLTCIDAVEPDQLASELESIARIELQQREFLLTSQGPPVALSAPPTLSLTDVRKRLDSATIVLVYSLGEETSALWWLDHNDLEVFELPPRHEIETQVRRIHGRWSHGQLLNKPQQVELDHQVLELAGQILGPVADRLDHQRLVVLPDGALHTLPFAALPNPLSGQLLVDRHETVTLPSLATWLALVDRRQANTAGQPPPLDVTIMADAVYSTDDPRLAPLAVAEDEGCIAPSQLPDSALEAKALQHLLPAGRLHTRLGFEATRDAFLEGSWKRSRIVHLAIHGELREDRPELSHLVLSRFDQHGAPRSSRVFTHEIDDLELDVELVVLSGCDTGRGKIVRGEGVLGLTQAFLAAGADRALVSLWPVSDRATTVLMQHFYRALLVRGVSPGAALRQAQQQMRQEPRFAEPFSWAGFVLIGDWQWTFRDAEVSSIHPPGP